MISFDLGGQANGRPGFYSTDKNNFAPMLAAAWSPDFGDNWFGRLVGRDGRSVLRGGFRMLYDRVGSQLAFRATSAREDFGRYIGSQTPVGETRPGRVLQFALRYEF